MIKKKLSFESLFLGVFPQKSAAPENVSLDNIFTIKIPTKQFWSISFLTKTFKRALSTKLNL